MAKFDTERLKERVRERLSERRFRHTLGVCELATFLADGIVPNMRDEVYCAAMLHDVAKELPIEEQLKLIDRVRISEEDLKTPSVYHAFAAVSVILRDFPEYATENVLSAAFNHTTGAPDMSLFDCIIFVSDFAEAGREYPSCLEVRKKLLTYIAEAKTLEEKRFALFKATYDTANATIEALSRMQKKINSRTLLTKNAFEAKIKHI